MKQNKRNNFTLNVSRKKNTKIFGQRLTFDF